MSSPFTVENVVDNHCHGIVSGLQIAVNTLEDLLQSPIPNADLAATLKTAINALNAGIAANQ